MSGATKVDECVRYLVLNFKCLSNIIFKFSSEREKILKRNTSPKVRSIYPLIPYEQLRGG